MSVGREGNPGPSPSSDIDDAVARVTAFVESLEQRVARRNNPEGPRDSQRLLLRAKWNRVVEGTSRIEVRAALESSRLDRPISYQALAEALESSQRWHAPFLAS